uniref:SLy proteins associated disordered region domain-containing protein n=1 Tax=Laticauda laticaudata TaxID=8630 RepID=A0A8C5S2U0_LATLA
MINNFSRLYSFGKFDHHRHHSTSKPNDSSEVQLRQNKPNNGGSIGKKMRAISLTMKKKMGKKYIRALSEEMVNFFFSLLFCTLRLRLHFFSFYASSWQIRYNL